MVVMLGPVPEGVTVMAAEACLLGSAMLVAVTATALMVETKGAVKSPVFEIVPELADHVTRESLVSRTVAVNCCVAPEFKLALVGESVMITPVVPDGDSATVRVIRLSP